MSDRKEGPPVVDGDCLAAMDHLYAFLSGELSAGSRDHAMVAHHLSHCRSCFSRAEMERLLMEKLKTAGAERAPEDLKRRLGNLLGDS